MKTDLLDAMDNQKVTCLILLDLSAAFDTVSHELLLNWLKFRFGITGSALSWIESYLTQRSQKVIIDDFESDHITLTQGVPKASVLGPILYTLLLAPWETCADHMVYVIMDMLMILKITTLSVQIYLEMRIPVSRPLNVVLMTLEYG